MNLYLYFALFYCQNIFSNYNFHLKPKNENVIAKVLWYFYFRQIKSCRNVETIVPRDVIDFFIEFHWHKQCTDDIKNMESTQFYSMSC